MYNFKTILNTLVFTFCITNVASSFAANPGIIDRQKVIYNSLAYQSIVKQVEEKNEGYKNEVQKIEADLKKRYEDIKAKENTLSKEIIEKKNSAISKELTALQNRSYNEKANQEKAYLEAVQKLVHHIDEAVKNKAVAQSYDIIIDKSAIAYVKDSIDITDAVVAEVNQKLADVKVNFEQKKDVTTINKIEEKVVDKVTTSKK